MSDSFASQVVKNYPHSDSELVLLDVSATTKTLVRADLDTTAAAELGVGFGQSRPVDDALIVGSRPDEWIVLGAVDAVATICEGLDESGHVSQIDFTHGRALFRLTGIESPRVLEKLCSIDWADAMMPDGAVVSASVAKVGCDIIRNDVDAIRSYLIMSDRSSAQYLFDAILDAGTEFDLGTRSA